MSKNHRKIERIFCADEDWQANACLNGSHDSIDLFAIGYKKSGDRLVKYIVEKTYDQDVMVYPILFLYRHYIELRLKEIIREGRILLKDGDSFPKHHKIIDLWNTAKAIAISAFENEPEPLDLNHAEHVIVEFSQIDSDSLSFRYPESKEGYNPLEGMTHINIRRVADHINELAKELENISLGISVYRDLQEDMWSSI